MSVILHKRNLIARGICEPSTFYKNFKELYGKAPEEFLKDNN